MSGGWRNPYDVAPYQVWRDKPRPKSPNRSMLVLAVNERGGYASVLRPDTGRRVKVQLKAFDAYEMTIDPRKQIDLNRTIQEVVARCVNGEVSCG